MIVSPFYLWRLRRLEKTDPELCARVDQTYSDGLAQAEDRLVTNQFTAMGSLKPGLVRLVTTIGILWTVNWGARHLFTRGRLARIRTIHFARWVFLDGRKRMVFFSNYDGTVESYMDDFINKTGFGLNMVFSNGIGYPRTNWLALDGCQDEQKYKDFLRRHTLPSQVWYKAYPGLTAIDLERNSRIRQGLEADIAQSKRRPGNGSHSYETRRSRFQRRAGPGPLRLRENDGSLLCAPADQGRGRARAVVAGGAGHERGHDESASFHRAPGCIHRARPGGDRRAGICH